MKSNTHPTYYPEAKVICACGNTFSTGATVKEIHVELCSACHPFYTGKQKLVDTARRVEKFKERVAKKSATGDKTTGKKAKRAKRAKRAAGKKAEEEKKDK